MLEVKYEKSEHGRVLKIGSWDFGYSTVKEGKYRAVALFFGRKGLVFSIPFEYWCVISKKKDFKNEDGE